MPYLSALEVCSRQGAIQIHVYFTLPYLTHQTALEFLAVRESAPHTSAAINVLAIQGVFEKQFMLFLFQVDAHNFQIRFIFNTSIYTKNYFLKLP